MIYPVENLLIWIHQVISTVSIPAVSRKRITTRTVRWRHGIIAHQNRPDLFPHFYAYFSLSLFHSFRGTEDGRDESYQFYGIYTVLKGGKYSLFFLLKCKKQTKIDLYPRRLPVRAISFHVIPIGSVVISLSFGRYAVSSEWIALVFSTYRQEYWDRSVKCETCRENEKQKKIFFLCIAPNEKQCHLRWRNQNNLQRTIRFKKKTHTSSTLKTLASWLILNCFVIFFL